MPDVAHLFQAFVSPAIFFSATALLILCINTRLMGIVSRLLLSCLLLGLGLYRNVAAESAAIVFVLSMISLLVCAAFFFREVTLALRSVQDEAHDLRD